MRALMFCVTNGFWEIDNKYVSAKRKKTGGVLGYCLDTLQEGREKRDAQRPEPLKLDLHISICEWPDQFAIVWSANKHARRKEK